MRKVFNKLKDRLADLDGPRSSKDNLLTTAAPRQFPDETDIYRCRKQRGVNLGSWFVLERWIAESPFRSAKAPAQSDLDIALGTDAKAILEKHWSTWISEQDWEWLADKGVNTVRIPIGYYHLCGIDPSIVRGTDFAGLEETFVAAWGHITNALATARRFGIGVLFDLHAAPGKQNADSHSGTSLEPSFFKKAQNMSHSTQVLSALVTHITTFARAHDPPLCNLVGIELLNEPQPGTHNDVLKKWYSDAFHAVRAIDPDLPLYISDSWMTNQYMEFIKDSNTPFVVLDHHLYRCFTSSDIATSASDHARRLRDANEETPTMFARVAKELESAGSGLVVGEWSAALNPGSLQGGGDERDAKRQYADAQLGLYDQHCAGWFFWTYKKEHGGDTGWSFRDAIEAGVLPPQVRPRRDHPERTSKSTDEKKESRRDAAFEEHKSHWAQYPGNYEHWRFYDGFTMGWDDAMLFASWKPTPAGSFIDELGFKGPWAKRRTAEHVAKKGRGLMDAVWEFQHGFTQGYQAAMDEFAHCE